MWEGKNTHIWCMWIMSCCFLELVKLHLSKIHPCCPCLLMYVQCLGLSHLSKNLWVPSAHTSVSNTPKRLRVTQMIQHSNKIKNMYIHRTYVSYVWKSNIIYILYLTYIYMCIYMCHGNYISYIMLKMPEHLDCGKKQNYRLCSLSRIFSRSRCGTSSELFVSKITAEPFSNKLCSAMCLVGRSLGSFTLQIP